MSAFLSLNSFREMNTEFCFEHLNRKNQYYNVQGKVLYEPLFFYSRNKTAVISFIICDVNEELIECVGFGEQAVNFADELQIDKIYQINYVETVDNRNYVKTSHTFKLQLTADSQIVKLQKQKYIKNDKICVKSIIKKKKKKTKKEQQHQLSITNWFK